MLAEKIRTSKAKKIPVKVLSNVRKLSEIAIDVVARNFELYPKLTGISKEFRDKVLTKIIESGERNISIKCAAINIYEEEYWKSICKPFENCFPEDHGGSYKQAYLERYVEDIIENWKVDSDINQLESLLISLKDFIFCLNIRSLLSHLNVNILFKNLINLSSLSVTFGAKYLDINYDRAAFGMKIQDGENIRECIEKTKGLVFLGLPNNMIDKEITSVLINGLMLNKSICQLDLSHNLIDDLAAKKVAKCLLKTQILTHLNLSDNLIMQNGAIYLSQALIKNVSLISLNLKQNKITDNAAGKLCMNLMQNKTLKELNLASNNLCKYFAHKICELLRIPTSALEKIDISCNQIEDRDGYEIMGALLENPKITEFDIRNNKLTKDNLSNLNKVISKHYLKKLEIPYIDNYQRPVVEAPNSPSQKSSPKSPLNNSSQMSPKINMES